VPEIVKTFENVSGCTIPYKMSVRRGGDIAQCWADPTLAEVLLGWTAKRDLNQMCADVWRWQSSHQ